MSDLERSQADGASGAQPTRETPDAQLPVGKLLDALIAECLFDYSWRKSRSSGRRCIYAPHRAPDHMEQYAEGTEDLVSDWNSHTWTPAYSTDMAAAWSVVQAMSEMKYRATMGQDTIAYLGKWHCEFDGGEGHGYEEGVPLPEAICIAALRALGVAEPWPADLFHAVGKSSAEREPAASTETTHE